MVFFALTRLVFTHGYSYVLKCLILLLIKFCSARSVTADMLIIIKYIKKCRHIVLNSLKISILAAKPRVSNYTKWKIRNARIYGIRASLVPNNYMYIF